MIYIDISYKCLLNFDFSWFCHFDDDQYVNIIALQNKLRKLSSDDDWYLGKASIDKSLEIIVIDSSNLKVIYIIRFLLKNKLLFVFFQKKISFWFATGGAGFCLSQSLTDKMRKHAADGKFVLVSDKMHFPDDVTLGYVVDILCGVQMTHVQEFHSHLEPLNLVRNLANQISFSYSTYLNNVIEINGFSESEDPTRFQSIHCHLHPYVSFCPIIR